MSPGGNTWDHLKSLRRRLSIVWAATFIPRCFSPQFNGHGTPGSGIRLLDEQGQIAGTVGALDHRAYGVTPVQAGYGVEVYLPAPLGDRALPLRRARREVAALDLSVFLAANTTAARVAQAIADVLGEASVATRLLDVYPHDGTGAQPQSVTFRVIYEAQRGTPKTVWEELRTQLEQRLGARVRA